MVIMERQGVDDELTILNVCIAHETVPAVPY